MGYMGKARNEMLTNITGTNGKWVGLYETAAAVTGIKSKAASEEILEKTAHGFETGEVIYLTVTIHGGGRTSLTGGALRASAVTVHGGGHTTVAGLVQPQSSPTVHGGGQVTVSAHVQPQAHVTVHGGGSITVGRPAAQLAYSYAATTPVTYASGAANPLTHTYGAATPAVYTYGATSQ